MTSTINVKVRRLDCKDVDHTYKLEIEPNITYPEFKTKIMRLLNISVTDDKILKIRNSDEVLIPLTNILDANIKEKFIIIDVTKIHQDVPAQLCDSSLNSVYIDAVRLKLHNMESRIARVETIVPHLKWRRQSLVERTTHNLGSCIAFLDRRIDELTPPQWNDKLQTTMS